MQQPPAPSSTRSSALDFLRGVAILLVLGCHFVVWPCEAGRLRYLSISLERFGWTGVDLFFVLSGFLIGGLLFKEIKEHGTLDVRRFLIRRVWKIWPAYFVFLAFVFVHLVRHGEGAVPALRSLLPNLLHVQNYFGSPRTQTWSLAVEEHFYLALPILLALLIRRRGATQRSLALIPWIAGALAVICLALRLWFNAGRPFTGLALAATQFRMDSLFAGVCLAYLFHFHRPRFEAIARRRRLLLSIAGLLCLPMLWTGLDRNSIPFTVGFTALYIGYACLLLVFVGITPGCGKCGRLLTSYAGRIVAFVGTYSYSIYLWHRDLGQFPAQVRIRPWFDSASPEIRWLIVTAAYFVMAILGGVLMFYLVERPALAVRDLLFPPRSPASSAL